MTNEHSLFNTHYEGLWLRYMVARSSSDPQLKVWLHQLCAQGLRLRETPSLLERLLLN